MKIRALSLLFVAAAYAIPAVADSPPPNFGVVVKDGIYRGGQPSNADQFEYLKKIGVKTILKLNHHGLDRESVDAKRLGLTLVQVPFAPETIGREETCGDVARALELLTDRSNWPVYVHCSRGRDRTGFIVGAYRELVEHWTWTDVDRELAAYGHTGGVRRAYPNITEGLQEGVPSCTQNVERKATGSAPPSTSTP